eukprot:8985275-Alexandrium_andersonii.AAC.1
MSASLVGSEMCIRDRSSMAIAHRLCTLPPLAACRVPAVCASERARLRVPVSYTHLTLPTICSV